MMRWRQIFRYSVYRNMLFYFVILIAVAVIAVSSALYVFFANRTANTVADNVISTLNQTSYTSNVVQEQILTIGNQLLSDNRIIAVLMSRHPDPLIDRDAIKWLRDIHAIYPIIKYIGVYNDTTERYLSTAGAPYEASDSLREQLNLRKDSQYIDFFPQKLNNENVLTFVLRPKHAISTAYSGGGAIVIHVDENYIMETIRSIGGASNDVFVMNEQGVVLSHTSPAEFMQPYADRAHMDRILGSDRDAGHFIASVGGDRQLFTYVKSSQLKWIFVSVKPYGQLVSDLSILRNFTWVIAIVMIMIGILLAAIVTNRIYNPLGQLMTRIQTVTGKPASSPGRSRDEYSLLSEAFSNVIEQASVMENEMKHSVPVLKKTYLEHALKGTLSDLWGSHVVANELRDQFSGPYFTVILAKIDRFRELSASRSLKELGLFRYAVCNIGKELLQKHKANDPIVVDEETIAILVQSEAAELPASIVLALGEIQRTVRSYFKFTVTFSVGATVNDQTKIHGSYQSAQYYAAYRLFYGRESIIQEELLGDRPTRNEQYPAAAEKKLVEALRVNREEKIAQAIGQFMKAIGEMTYYQALSYCNQLLITLMKEFDGTLQIMKDYAKECYGMINRLPEQETLSEIEALIREYCGIISSLQSKKNAAKNNNVIESVCRYLHEHYDQPDLGVEMMADKVQLSPSYLGKLFRTHTEMSFNDYLKTIRLEKAKSLLLNTDEPVSSISEKVGIVNSNYFFSLFKKMYGISPAAFREQHAGLQLDMEKQNKE